MRCVFVDGRLENKETQTDAHQETPVLTTKIDFLDSDRVVDGPPEPELLCSICQNVLWKPVACITCENAFCSKCIHMWIERLDVSCQTTCPFKCNFNKKRAPPILNSLLSKLKIYCVYRDNGCQQILNYDVLENHQQTCDYKDIVCPVCQMCITKQDPTNTVHDIRQCFAGIKNTQTVGQIQAQLTMLLDIIDHQKKHIQTLENRLNSSTE
ncbi:hypothetical protein I4U23_015195 [Adineta vaga]|nr:hypothetical protein I4U23_015195 [Adineta vaga]